MAIDRVAFIFAGNGRSFDMYPVYDSLRENLISSFCPVGRCTADVFLRISLTDNIHAGLFDSAGLLLSKQVRDASLTSHAISRLNVHEEIGGRTLVDWKDIGSEEEKKDMDRYLENLSYLGNNLLQQRHKIFRALDPRRYSMYFNRWSAYMMAVAEEKRTGVKYSWIVHSRLDTMWGEPIKPLYIWSLQKVWVIDTWDTEVPDTFALLPRNASDAFFSIDGLVQKGVMCLGGPNFNPSTLQHSYLLETLKFSPSDLDIVDSSICTVLYWEFNVYDEQKNATWSNGGCSEQILKRKLDKVVIIIHINHRN